MSQSVKYLPAGLFGGVMGLEGLGLACRGAPLPYLAIFGEFWIWLGLLALAALLPAYVVKLVRYPAAVRDEFLNPAYMGFCATLPLALTLCGGGVWPYWQGLADVLWGAGAGSLLALQMWALSRWIGGGIELGQVNGGWMMIMIGGIVVPGTGIAIGNPEMSRFMFGLSAAATPFVMGLVFYRTVVGPALPEPLRPTWFIFLVPPSLIYANGLLLSSGAGVFLDGSFYGALLLAPALLLLLAARGFLHWPFTPAWWAFTFPLDALATAASRHAQVHASTLWEAIYGLALLVAVFFVAFTGWKTARAYLRGALMAAPAKAGTSSASGGSDALIVVDVQNSFIPGGSLAVQGGDEVVPVVNRLAPRFAHVVLTQDWHPAGHRSFASSHPGKKPFETARLPYGEQVLWPDHCVQGTEGAELHKDLSVPNAQLVIRKGCNRDVDSYSAFIEADRTTRTGLEGYLRERGVRRVFVCGLATDFCVAWTALDARDLGFEVAVVEDACRAIDNQGSLAEAWRRMDEAGVERVNSSQLT